MPLSAAMLLDGPRGRRLCLELLRAGLVHDESREGRDASSALFWAAHALDQGSSAILSLSDDDEDPAPFEPPLVGPRAAATALARIEPAALSRTVLRAALAASVDHAMYWQPPDGHDMLAGTAHLRPVLARVAEAVATSPLARWWVTPVALDDQWSVPWDGGATMQDHPAAVLAEWRDRVAAEEERAERERPRDPEANWSGTWWSRPPSALVHSTRSLGADGPAGMWFVEDSLGWAEATATRVRAEGVRVHEITSASDWTDLCRRHPLDVTASRRHDWYRVTGRDGVWVQPDWASVADETDAVHLTVAGYLSAATRLIDVGDGAASVIAGWGPDETYWFAPVRAGETARWRRVDDEWTPVDAAP